MTRPTNRRAARPVLLAGTIAIAAACAGDGKDQDSILRAALDSLPLVTRDSVPRVAWSDANIVALLDAVNAADSASGALAVERARGAEVKEFGRAMMRDHHGLREQGRALASKLRLTPEPVPNDSSAQVHEAAMAQLRGLPADRFDAAWIAHEVGAHQRALDIVRTAAREADNAELRTLATNAAPVVQRHLDRAKALQAGRGGAGDTSPGTP